MGQIWVREFLGGLDTRRMPETTPGGVLVQADNGHITAGGEFESRAAFVERYVLPAGTHGLAATRSQLVVFGSGSAPSMPAGVTYQRIRHPDGATALADVLSWDLYAGKIYVVGVFADGSRHHFYDGVRVKDWFDGRARAVFSVVSGGTTPATAARGSFRVTAGTAAPGNGISQVRVNGVDLIPASVAHTGDNITTAANIAAAITAFASVPKYTATSDGDTVTIISATPGAGANGRVLGVVASGDVVVSAVTSLSGGVAASVATVTSIRVDGVSTTNAPVQYVTNNSATALAIANAITADISTPEYTAIAIGDTVVITADTAGKAANGLKVEFTLANGMVLSPATGLVMSGGADNATAFTPGTFVKTIGSKMYSLSGPNMHFSGIQKPTGWTTDSVGAGFIDLSIHSSGAEQLLAIERYQQNLAVFAETNVQIWFIDPDPALNTIVQILSNTGTSAQNSVTQFGDSDIFYLNESGIRSLRARDASNSAATADIGVSIDKLVTEALAGLGALDRGRITGLVEPRDGRLWMIIGSTVFVLSYFRAEKTVSAWSIYKLPAEIAAATVFNRKVWMRFGDSICVYGGAGAEREYDASECVVRTPFLDGDSPTQWKNLTAIDIAAEGEWEVFVSMDVNDPNAIEPIGIVRDSTFTLGRVPAQGSASHFSFTFKSRGVGPHRLGSLVVHFTNDDSSKDAS